MLHNGIKYCAALAAVALFSAAACSDDETTPTTTGNNTTTTTTGGGMGGSGGGGLDCAALCGALYDCGLEADGADQLCPGFTGDPAEKTAFVGDSMSGCVQTCEGPTGSVLAGQINPDSCSDTVSSIKGLSTDFANVCDNGFGTGGAGGAGGGTGGAGGAGGGN